MSLEVGTTSSYKKTNKWIALLPSIKYGVQIFKLPKKKKKKCRSSNIFFKILSKLESYLWWLEVIEGSNMEALNLHLHRMKGKREKRNQQKAFCTKKRKWYIAICRNPKQQRLRHIAMSATFEKKKKAKPVWGIKIEGGAIVSESFSLKKK